MLHVFELKPCNHKSREMCIWIETLQELSERMRTFLILNQKKNDSNNNRQNGNKSSERPAY